MTESLTIDDCQTQVHRHEWSAGDLAITCSAGVTWLVYAHRKGQHVVAEAASRTDAWREAWRLIASMG